VDRIETGISFGFFGNLSTTNAPYAMPLIYTALQALSVKDGRFKRQPV